MFYVLNIHYSNGISVNLNLFDDFSKASDYIINLLELNEDTSAKVREHLINGPVWEWEWKRRARGNLYKIIEDKSHEVLNFSCEIEDYEHNMLDLDTI